MTRKSRCIMLENTATEDPRWIKAGADAFAVHIAACCYSDRRNSDGIIHPEVAPRVSLAVPADRGPAAIAALLDAGFWAEENGSYRIVGYLEDGIALSKKEQDDTRARWAEDARRKRMHGNGNHSICDPKKCPYLREHSGESPTGLRADSGESPPLRQDPTRLDSTLRESRERSRDGRAAPAANADSAKAPSATAPAPPSPWKRPKSRIIDGNTGKEWKP